MIQIPDEVMDDRRLGFGEMIYYGCMLAGKEPEFGESESTVKRRKKLLKDCGLIPIEKAGKNKVLFLNRTGKVQTQALHDTSTVQVPAVDGAERLKTLESYCELLLERPRNVGSRGRKMLEALTEMFGSEKVFSSCRLLVIQSEYTFGTVRNLMDALKKLLVKGKGIPDGEVDTGRLLDAFSLVCHSTGAFAKEKIRLLGVMYGEKAVIDACKKAALKDAYFNSSEWAETIRKILEGRKWARKNVNAE